MKIAIIGLGNIGGNIALQLHRAGRSITVCFSRDMKSLKQKAAQLGNDVNLATVAEAAKNSDVVVLAVPWPAIDAVLEEAGNLKDKVVIDATNQFGPEGLLSLPTTAAEYNQTRMPGAHLVRSFNMFYASYQAEVGAGRHRPASMFFATNSEHAGALAKQIITDAGFVPIYLGGLETAKYIEMPDGVLVGKVFTPEVAEQIATAARSNNQAELKELANISEA